MHLDRQIALAVRNDVLNLIILPTENCNFRCTYCYEDFKIGKMKPNTAEAIKKFIYQRVQELKMINLSWFGGEPLIAKDIIFNISEYILELKKNYNSDLIYTSDITTNAFLLKVDLFEKLVDKGITTYQISLDGAREEHNKTRLRINGSGSFDYIWDNLKNIKKTSKDFKIILRLHITPSNIESIISFANSLKETFGDDKRFDLLPKPIGNWGGPNSANIKTISNVEGKVIVEQIKNIWNRETINGCGASSLSSCTVCYASKPNNFVIRANGRLAKCTVFFDSGMNDIGYIADDGTIHLKQDKIAHWSRGLFSKDEKILQCPAGK